LHQTGILSYSSLPSPPPSKFTHPQNNSFSSLFETGSFRRVQAFFCLLTSSSIPSPPPIPDRLRSCDRCRLSKSFTLFSASLSGFLSCYVSSPSFSLVLICVTARGNHFPDPNLSLTLTLACLSFFFRSFTWSALHSFSDPSSQENLPHSIPTDRQSIFYPKQRKKNISKHG
jgi:hypothetical protein